MRQSLAALADQVKTFGPGDGRQIVGGGQGGGMETGWERGEGSSEPHPSSLSFSFSFSFSLQSFKILSHNLGSGMVRAELGLTDGQGALGVG
jgi:hypothetical protein